MKRKPRTETVTKGLFEGKPKKQVLRPRGPDWSMADPFAHLPKQPMVIKIVDNRPTVSCDCGRGVKNLFYVMVEKARLELCANCLAQQVQASASRDTLVRIVGVCRVMGKVKRQ